MKPLHPGLAHLNNQDSDGSASFENTGFKSQKKNLAFGNVGAFCQQTPQNAQKKQHTVFSPTLIKPGGTGGAPGVAYQNSCGLSQDNQKQQLNKEQLLLKLLTLLKSNGQQQPTESSKPDIIMRKQSLDRVEKMPST